MRISQALPVLLVLWAGLLPGWHCKAQTFRVATYNLENYIQTNTSTRTGKSPEGKAKILESIRAIRPDVLALQELGNVDALLELRDSLKVEGLSLTNWEFVSASDTNIHIGLLSRFPVKSSRAYTNECFLLDGRRFHVSRGFLEAEITVNPQYSFTLLAAHLKSKRAMLEADEAELRLQEAILLRDKIEARLRADPGLNLIVLGDFNDTKDSASTRAVIGKGSTRLIDTRPAERNSDDASSSSGPEQRSICWTHYYSKEDSYRRIDFLLISRGMAREWIPQQSYVLALANWGQASDHRPLVVSFEAADR